MSSARRHLVALRAGLSSLHPAWFTPNRDFDLLVDAHAGNASDYEGTCDILFSGLGETGSLAQHQLFSQHPGLLGQYESVWLPDDDIQTTTAQINLLFQVHREVGFDLAQPALSVDSYFTHSMLVQHQGFSVRETNFVESMVPVFTSEAMAVCLPTLAESHSGYGLEVVWQALLKPLGGRTGVYDCLPVRHTRPVGALGVQGASRRAAFEEMASLIGRYDAPDPSVHLVLAAWDEDFSAVAPEDLAGRLDAGFPTTVRQAPPPWDRYARGPRTLEPSGAPR